MNRADVLQLLSIATATARIKMIACGRRWGKSTLAGTMALTAADALSTKIVEDFNGEVPATLEELITLPGVGRKTANVVLGHAFGIPGITVDTHFGRLSRRFQWSASMDPVKVEHEVGELIPQPEWTNLSQRMIWHGRRVCHSRKPACGACTLAKICPSVGIGEMDSEKAALLVKTDKDFR